jgi:hypothetical protein
LGKLNEKRKSNYRWSFREQVQQYKSQDSRGTSLFTNISLPMLLVKLYGWVTAMLRSETRNPLSHKSPVFGGHSRSEHDGKYRQFMGNNWAIL